MMGAHGPGTGTPRAGPGDGPACPFVGGESIRVGPIAVDSAFKAALASSSSAIASLVGTGLMLGDCPPSADAQPETR